MRYFRPHMSVNPTFAALEWALRVILAAACGIHSILDITDPFTKAKSSFLQVEDSIPRWLLPAVGILRAVASVALLSNDAMIVLGGLAYCSMLYGASGAMRGRTDRAYVDVGGRPAEEAHRSLTAHERFRLVITVRSAACGSSLA